MKTPDDIRIRKLAAKIFGCTYAQFLYRGYDMPKPHPSCKPEELARARAAIKEARARLTRREAAGAGIMGSGTREGSHEHY